ncbi:MAG: hypothetical protein KIT83_03575 [Bryobacterales bacterium]|nr:hypothetical protein [Bryobacterales bacterium]
MAQSHDWLIVPGQRVGPVHAGSSVSALRALLGNEAVVESAIEVGEGLTEPGFVVYPQDPSKALAVMTSKRYGGSVQMRILVCYLQRRDAPCRWSTREGISLGTSLSDLEKLNRRPFRLHGFAYDYEGAVASWQGGVLGSLQSEMGSVRLHLTPTISSPQHHAWLRQVTGDREFSSAHPAMRPLAPTVYAIAVEFSPFDSR